jgi:hypothetical protein
MAERPRFPRPWGEPRGERWSPRATLLLAGLCSLALWGLAVLLARAGA